MSIGIVYRAADCVPKKPQVPDPNLFPVVHTSLSMIVCSLGCVRPTGFEQNKILFRDAKI